MKNQFPGLSILIPAGLLAFASVLSGCQERPPGSYTQAEYRAEPSEVQHNLYFQAGSSRLATGEQDRLNRILRPLLLRQSDDIVINMPSSGSDILDAQRNATARSAVSWTPARIRFVAAPGFDLQDQFPDVALVQVMRYSKTVVVCPNQGMDYNDDLFRRREILIGCTNAFNIANMADEKRDLTAPGNLSPTTSQTDVRAVDRYRAGTTTAPDVAYISN